MLRACVGLLHSYSDAYGALLSSTASGGGFAYAAACSRSSVGLSSSSFLVSRGVSGSWKRKGPSGVYRARNRTRYLGSTTLSPTGRPSAIGGGSSRSSRESPRRRNSASGHLRRGVVATTTEPVGNHGSRCSRGPSRGPTGANQPFVESDNVGRIAAAARRRLTRPRGP